MVVQSKYLVLSLFAAAAAATVSVAAYMTWRRNRRKQYHQVGQVSGLYIYPVKSCKGLPLESAKCLSQGLKHDRRWVILNGKGNFITQRQQPSLALVTPTLKLSEDGELECLYLDAPNMETLKVELPLTTQEFKNIEIFGTEGEGQLAGEEAGIWFSTYLNMPGCQLFHMSKPRELIKDKVWGENVAPEDKSGFGDFAPVLIVTTEALAALNKELESPVIMKRFRPNIVVTGTTTYDEDNWKRIKIQDVEMRYLKHCDRCSMITVDPEKGVKTGAEPLLILRRIRMPEDRDKRYGNSPFFGLHTIAIKEGEIKVGDTVYAKE